MILEALEKEETVETVSEKKTVKTHLCMNEKIPSVKSMIKESASMDLNVTILTPPTLSANPSASLVSAEMKKNV